MPLQNQTYGTGWKRLVIVARNVSSGICTGVGGVRAAAGDDFPGGLAVRKQQAVNHRRRKFKLDLEIADLGMPGPLGYRREMFG